MDDSKIIDDVEKVSEHEGKIITIIKTNIYNYELKDWVNINYINWRALSSNPNTLRILEDMPNKIDWNHLSKNPNAIHLLENNLEKIDWDELSIKADDNIVSYHEDYTKIDCYLLSKNPAIFG